jgi:hypothetical protein
MYQSVMNEIAPPKSLSANLNDIGLKMVYDVLVIDSMLQIKCRQNEIRREDENKGVYDNQDKVYRCGQIRL